MIADVFIRRPRFAFVISILLTIVGVIALRVIPVAQFPDIVPPQVKVTALYPGASASAVEESVGQVIEGQVNGVERMLYMKSTSGGDGSYTLSVSFEVGSDPDLNTVNVTNRVNQAVSQLPPEVQRVGVTVKKQSAALLQVVAVSSPGGTRDALFLSNFVTLDLLDTLRRVPGVGEASIFGSLDYSMRVWLDLNRLSSLGLTADDVVKAIQSQNVQAAVGRVGAAPFSQEVDFQLNITTQGRLTSVARSLRTSSSAPIVQGAVVKAEGRRSRRARRQVERLAGPLQRQAGRGHPDLPGCQAPMRSPSAEGVRQVLEERPHPLLPSDVKPTTSCTTPRSSSRSHDGEPCSTR
jgi:multidrug efflux pump subunit AcrB